MEMLVEFWMQTHWYKILPCLNANLHMFVAYVLESEHVEHIILLANNHAQLWII